MKKYKVAMARIEHQIFRFEVVAANEKEAEEIVEQRWDDGDYDSDAYEVVHAEEFINQVDEEQPA